MLFGGRRVVGGTVRMVCVCGGGGARDVSVNSLRYSLSVS